MYLQSCPIYYQQNHLRDTPGAPPGSFSPGAAPTGSGRSLIPINHPSIKLRLHTNDYTCQILWFMYI
jgi:hypothetical protein